MILLRKRMMNGVHLWECASAWLVPSSTVQSHLLELSPLEPGTVSIFDVSGRLSRTQPAAAAVTSFSFHSLGLLVQKCPCLVSLQTC